MKYDLASICFTLTGVIVVCVVVGSWFTKWFIN